MKAIDFLKRLESKEFFKEFKKENPDFFLCAFFCILDKKESEGDKVHIDFFIPSKKKIVYSEFPFQNFCFSQDEKVKMSLLEKLDLIKIDLGDLWEFIEELKKEKNIQHITEKIIAVLTKDEWSLTCLSPTLDLLRLKINVFTKEVKEIKKEGMADIIRIQKTKPKNL
jgi:hypothetical protein